MKAREARGLTDGGRVFLINDSAFSTRRKASASFDSSTLAPIHKPSTMRPTDVLSSKRSRKERFGVVLDRITELHRCPIPWFQPWRREIALVVSANAVQGWGHGHGAGAQRTNSITR